MAEETFYFKDRFAQLLDVSPDSGEYNHKMAWLMAEMAHLAYAKFEDSKDDVLDGPLEKAGFTLVNSYSDREKDTQAFLATRSEPDMAVLCYRGTDSIRDWKQNIEAKRDEVDDGVKVHGGFREEFLALEKPIKADLMTLAGVPVFFCGHSLGGALATLAGYFFPREPALSDVPFRSCYTFGGPRVGNLAFARVLNNALPVHRIVREGDPVAEVPALPGSYKHAGEIYYLDEDGDLTAGVSKWIRIPKLGGAILEDVGKEGLAAIKAHNHQSYADKLGDYGLSKL